MRVVMLNWRVNEGMAKLARLSFNGTEWHACKSKVPLAAVLVLHGWSDLALTPLYHSFKEAKGRSLR